MRGRTGHRQFLDRGGDDGCPIAVITMTAGLPAARAAAIRHAVIVAVARAASQDRLKIAVRAGLTRSGRWLVGGCPDRGGLALPAIAVRAIAMVAIAIVMATVAASMIAITAMMFPPRAPSTPIVQMIAPHRVTRPAIIEQIDAIAGIIEIVVPAAAKADLDKAAAIVRAIIAIIAITIVIGIRIAIIIGVPIARRAIAVGKSVSR